MRLFRYGNWGLRLLALLLAIVLYHALKKDSSAPKSGADERNDRSFFHYR
jgi:hypothetical protein